MIQITNRNEITNLCIVTTESNLCFVPSGLVIRLFKSWKVIKLEVAGGKLCVMSEFVEASGLPAHTLRQAQSD